jgi:3-methyladenine DNA glycosylase/8-oxoguanine DNA glycosylase
MVEDVVAPRGPYRLSLMTRGRPWSSSLPDGRRAEAWQRPDGRVAVRATDEDGLATARFQLALDDDTAEFHTRFRHDPLLGPSARHCLGYRPLRLPTVAHALLRAFCGQLIEARRAAAIERAVLRHLEVEIATRAAVADAAPSELRRCGLAQHRATALVRTTRAIDLEKLRVHPTAAVRARLTREPEVGPWTVGVVVLEGLGRYDHPLTGDLGLVKLMSSLRGRWVEAAETDELLAPYGEWQGLAGMLLMRGWSAGLVPGADPDRGRQARVRARRAA